MKTKRKALLAALEKIKEGEILGFLRLGFSVLVFFSLLCSEEKIKEESS